MLQHIGFDTDKSNDIMVADGGEKFTTGSFYIASANSVNGIRPAIWIDTDSAN